MYKLALVSAALAACSPSSSSMRSHVPTATVGIDHAIASCPSALQGAETRLRKTHRGIDVYLTSDDPFVRAEIVRLVEHNVREPARFGACPILRDGTQISLQPFRDGIVVHVAARSSHHVKAVQEQTEARLAAMPSWRPRVASQSPEFEISARSAR
jgi:hypothetical protein